MEGLKVLPYDQGKQICRENCAYACLLFISCLGEISHSKLTLFLSNYTIEKGGVDSQFTEHVISSLLKSGQIYEVRGGFYLALPSYAVQRGLEEWVILGDARVDHIFRKEALVFEVTSHAKTNVVTLERLLLATPEDADRIFQVTGTRAFQLTELVELIPDAESLSVPKAWPNYVLSSYLSWQVLDRRGRWESIKSESDIAEGLCRRLITNSEGKVVSTRYFFRHKDGWSPITSEEAYLWVFKLAAMAGDPYLANFLTGKNVLTMPVRLPYTAYFVLKFLGHKGMVRGDKFVVEGVDCNIAQSVCQKLCIRLGVEVGS